MPINSTQYRYPVRTSVPARSYTPARAPASENRLTTSQKEATEVNEPTSNTPQTERKTTEQSNRKDYQPGREWALQNGYADSMGVKAEDWSAIANEGKRYVQITDPQGTIVHTATADDWDKTPAEQQFKVLVDAGQIPAWSEMVKHDDGTWGYIPWGKRSESDIPDDMLADYKANKENYEAYGKPPPIHYNEMSPGQVTVTGYKDNKSVTYNEPEGTHIVFKNVKGKAVISSIKNKDGETIVRADDDGNFDPEDIKQAVSDGKVTRSAAMELFGEDVLKPNARKGGHYIEEIEVETTPVATATSPMETHPWLFAPTTKQQDVLKDTIRPWQRIPEAQFKSELNAKEQGGAIKLALGRSLASKDVTFDSLTKEQQTQVLGYYTINHRYLGPGGLQNRARDSWAQTGRQWLAIIPGVGTVAQLKASTKGRIPNVGDAVLFGVNVAGDVLVLYPAFKSIAVAPRELAWGTRLTIVDELRPATNMVMKVVNNTKGYVKSLEYGEAGYIRIAEPKLVSSKKFITVLSPDDVKMSPGMFDDFVKARVKEPTLTPEQFKARQPNVVYPQQKIPTGGADIDDFDAAVIRQKPTEGSNTPWNTELSEDAVRELVKQQNNSAAADLVRQAAENDARWRALAAASLARIPPKGYASNYTSYTPVDYDTKTDTVTYVRIDSRGKLQAVTVTVAQLAELVNVKTGTRLSLGEQAAIEAQARAQVQQSIQEATNTLTQTQKQTGTRTKTGTGTGTATRTATQTQTKVRTTPQTATTTATGVAESTEEQPPEQEGKGGKPRGETTEKEEKAAKPHAEYPEGTIAWKMGIGYWTWGPPWDQNEDAEFTIEKPEGITVYPNAKSAFDTIQRLGGSVPSVLTFNRLGIVKAHITSPPRSPSRMAGHRAISFERTSKARQFSGLRNKKVGKYFVAGNMVSRHPIGRRKVNS